MEQVNVKINGVSYEVPADSTILEAAPLRRYRYPPPSAT